MAVRQGIIPIFIPHLGCPHDCVFCNQKRISGSLLPAGPEDVRKAIERGLPKCKTPPQAAFYGGSFTAIPAAEQAALLEAAQPFLISGDISGIRLSTRPDAIDGETLARLKRFGVNTIELGAQSMSDEVLRRSGRGHSPEDTEKASRLIKAAGFQLILQMMTGLPGASERADVETARRIIALQPDGVRIYPTVIIKDTALYEMWRAEAYTEHTVEDAVGVCARILPLFEEAKIPVIRLGLNPTDDLTGGDAAGGAYHPALGELVKSRVMLQKARALLRERAHGDSVTLRVNPSCISQMTGQHRQNILALADEFSLTAVKIAGADIKPGEIEL